MCIRDRDTAVIAAKAAEILAKSRKDDGADTEEIGSEASAHEISGADFVARIQKNIENETGISSGTANEFFENRRRIVTPEDVYKRQIMCRTMKRWPPPSANSSERRF